MSGGVDSSVTAYLLKKKGYSAIGITFKLWPKNLCGSHGLKSCCSLEAINDARSVCVKLGIPHYVIDCEKLFKKEVIDYFIRSYEQGLTPNPCIVCNERIKFPLLLKKAKETGAEYIATGHHARCVFDKKNRRFLIKEGKDKNKDQSYVLFSLPQQVLAHLLLPVGDYTKDRIRAIAKELGLRQANKKESQEICFIPDNNLVGFLKGALGKKIKPGKIIDKTGRVLGEHPGTVFFTIGQRKGLRIPFGRPLYVTGINSRNSEVVAGGYEETLSGSLITRGLNWMGEVSKRKLIRAEVKIRYRHPRAKASIKLLPSGRCLVKFFKPQPSPAPGQAAVFYKRDAVIGGGWIEKISPGPA